jgi:hypothetical protein
MLSVWYRQRLSLRFIIETCWLLSEQQDVAEPVAAQRALWAVQVGQTLSSVTQNLRRTMQGSPQMNGRSDDGRMDVAST